MWRHHGQSLRLGYAETHFKFRLPWSPLYRAWPEVFLEAPSFCLPGQVAPFYLAVKDADHFPVRLREIQFTSATGAFPTQRFDFNEPLRENLRFLPLPFRLPTDPGLYRINAKVTLEKAGGRRSVFLNGNYPGVATPPLEVTQLHMPLPYPGGWLAGEVHCHSDYSSDPVEFGAPLEVLRRAGECLGLGFIATTDHSYDFYYRKDRYMEAVDPAVNFQRYRAEADALNRGALPHQPLLIAGEEVSCGNHQGENVHLLVMGHPEFLPGLGDGGRRWLRNHPDLSIPEVLERLGDTPGFAAHPKAEAGRLERFIFRRGRWHDPDVAPRGSPSPLVGLQFWNGGKGRDFHAGKEFWVSQLLRGNRLAPIAANDAHGDLNRNIFVKVPLFSLGQGSSHVFGRVRTLVRAGDKSLPSIQAAFRRGQVLGTDGPFLDLEREPSGSLRWRAASTPDFGPLSALRVVGGRKGARGEQIYFSRDFDHGETWEASEPVAPPSDCAYVRAEVRTRTGKSGLGAALWLD